MSEKVGNFCCESFINNLVIKIHNKIFRLITGKNSTVEWFPYNKAFYVLTSFNLFENNSIDVVELNNLRDALRMFAVREAYCGNLIWITDYQKLRK